MHSAVLLILQYFIKSPTHLCFCYYKCGHRSTVLTIDTICVATVEMVSFLMRSRGQRGCWGNRHAVFRKYTHITSAVTAGSAGSLQRESGVTSTADFLPPKKVSKTSHVRANWSGFVGGKCSVTPNIW